MQKTWMSLTAGILEIVCGVKILMAIFICIAIYMGAANRGESSEFTAILVSIPIIAVLAILSFAGGICAIKRKKWGFALAGSIAAAFPASIVGIASLILVILSRKEFQ